MADIAYQLNAGNHHAAVSGVCNGQIKRWKQPLEQAKQTATPVVAVAVIDAVLFRPVPAVPNPV